MGYLALYRKYRPNSFDDLVGQNSVSSIIKNEILNDKISHAYLFSGPRGTGKTSTAKIIAKMINCDNLGTDGVPCGKCYSCLNFKNSNDIVEIDAASNNGVDEIRDLCDKVNLVPTIGRYKIYIIDEVHMLTTQAFNALLKTLEEPPSHIVFILATTEFYKIPSTVVSRCQKFQFFKFSNEEIVARLSDIASLESIKVDDGVLYEIARLSDGGLRDAINMLDQLSSFSDGSIDIKDLYQLNAIVSYDDIVALLMFVVQNNVEDIVSFVNNIDKSGKNIDRFVADLIIFLKDVLLYKNTSSFGEVVINDKKNKIIEISNIFSLNVVYDMIFSLNDLANELKKSSFSVILLIVYFIRLSNKLKCDDGVELFDNAKKNEVNSSDNSVVGSNVGLSVKKFSSALKKIRINNTFSTASKSNKEEFLKKWNFMDKSFLFSNYDSVAGMIDDVDVLVVGDKNVMFLAKYDSLLERIYSYINEFEKLLYSLFDKEYKVVFLANDEWIYEKNKYIKNIKDGKKYNYIEENLISNIDIKNENNMNDIDKIVSLLGEDVILYK